MPDPADPDAVLMLRVKRGDRAEFAELAGKYQQPLFNFIFRTLRDEAESDDVAQNVFLQVYKSRQRYQPTAKFSTWLFTIARNLCLNEIRRRSRHPRRSSSECGRRRRGTFRHRRRRWSLRWSRRPSPALARCRT